MLGQMSIFGAHTGISDEIVLPKGSLETNRREILEWERELIGLYVSDHPLSPVMDALTQAVSHFSAQLSEAAPGEKVRVAGIVTRVRPHQTKTGKSMGFVTLEDVQGNIELVVFPRTWEKYWEVLEVDSVVLVDGKVDAQSGDPKVLVDSVTTDLKSIVSTEPQPPTSAKPSSPTVKPFPIPDSQIPEPPSLPEDWGDLPPPPDEFPPAWNALEVAPGGFIVETGNNNLTASLPTSTADETNAGMTNQVSATEVLTDGSDWPSVVKNEEATYPNRVDIAGVPLEPGKIVTEVNPSVIISSPTTVDLVPGAQGFTPLISTTIPKLDEPPLVSPVSSGDANVSLSSIPLEPVAHSPANGPVLGIDLPLAGVTTTPGEPGIVAPTYPSKNLSNPKAPNLGPELPTQNVGLPIAKPEVPNSGITVPPYTLPPAEAYAGQDLHMITVILRCGTDKVRDNLRLRQCYGIMISYSGHDRFALQIFERNRGYRIEFPNYTTLYSLELVARLASIVGADNVIVEPLRLH